MSDPEWDATDLGVCDTRRREVAIYSTPKGDKSIETYGDRCYEFGFIPFRTQA